MAFQETDASVCHPKILNTSARSMKMVLEVVYRAPVTDVRADEFGSP